MAGELKEMGIKETGIFSIVKNMLLSIPDSLEDPDLPDKRPNPGMGWQSQHCIQECMQVIHIIIQVNKRIFQNNKYNCYMIESRRKINILSTKD